MLLKDFQPAPAVQSFVQLYRIVHLEFDAGSPLPFKAYPPRPEHCLAFYPLDTEQVQFAQSQHTISQLPVVLYGQQLEVTNRFVGRNFLVFQIIFYPGALYRLTGIPAEVICNQYLDATLIFSNELHLINEQLFHAVSYAAMIDIANQFVGRLIQQQKKKERPIDAVCRLLLQSNGSYSVDQLAKAAYLSNKQLERTFKTNTGINPALYSRVIRFDHAFRLKNSHPEWDWLRIALECGYYDYQHLVRDYKAFTGMLPTAFHTLENKAPERQFGLVEDYYKG